MHLPSAYDLKSFYNGFKGRVVRGLIRKRVLEIWPEDQKHYLVGFGYVTPYLRPYKEQATRLINLMPQQIGVHNWPPEGQNIVALSTEYGLPLETNSVDRLLMVHGLEYIDYPAEFLKEAFRVLKSTGRLLIVVPNRMGFWARADWSPLGQGQPYSAGQVEKLLRDNLFVHEQTCQALFSPPFQHNTLLRMANIFEKIGQYVYPALGGVHIIEASKQIYASRGTGVPVESKRALRAAKTKPVPTPRTKL
jgi:SAM-dependent methyltransferase